jgi:hypothetical protein
LVGGISVRIDVIQKELFFNHEVSVSGVYIFVKCSICAQ